MHFDGTAWVCYPGKDEPFECGSKARDANIEKWPQVSSIMMYEKPINGYHGGFLVGAISRSWPAIEKFKKP